jgi:hypothetical protein
MLGFHKVVGLRLRSLVLSNPESFYVRLGEVRQFRIERIRFEARLLRPNQDGIHLGGGCEDGVIEDLFAAGSKTTSDDMVALNADDALERAPLRRLVNAPIRRVRIRKLRADDCHSFVRLLSVWSVIEDVEIEDVLGGCRVSAVNMDGARDARVPLFKPDDPAVADGVGRINRVVIRGMRVHKSHGGSHHPLLDLRSRCEDFRIEDFTRDDARDARPDVPTLRASDSAAFKAELEGLDRRQVEQMLSASRVDVHRILQLAGEEDALRLQVELSSTGVLDLPHGGVRRLQLRR